MRTLTLSILALMALAIVPAAAAQENDGSSFRKAFIRIQRQKAFKAWREQNAPRLAQMTKAELRQRKRQRLSGTPRAFAKGDAKARFDGKRQWVDQANRKAGKANSIWSKQGRRAAQSKNDKSLSPAERGGQMRNGKPSKIWSKQARRAAKSKAGQQAARPSSSASQLKQPAPKDASEPVGVGVPAQHDNDERRQQASSRINDVIRTNDKVAKASTRKLMRTRQWSRKARESTTGKKAAKFRARRDNRIASKNRTPSNMAPKSNRRANNSGVRTSAETPAEAQHNTPNKPMIPATRNFDEAPEVASTPATPKAQDKQTEKRVMSAASTLLSAPPQRDDDQ